MVALGWGVSREFSEMLVTQESEMNWELHAQYEYFLDAEFTPGNACLQARGGCQIP